MSINKSIQPIQHIQPKNKNDNPIEYSPINAKQVSSHNTSSCDSKNSQNSLVGMSPLILPSPEIKTENIQKKISNLQLK